MKVHLAGFNVDTAVLKELQANPASRQDITPEVISAAYARISRDPRPIEEIRKDARNEVEKTRKSNSSIIFKMGHHSVAEHAVFNLDIIGVSRLAMEELERFRLCSYTEKSQRYITLDNDFVVPQDIKNTGAERLFIDTVKVQNNAYFELFSLLKDHVFKKYPQLAENPKNHNLLEGWAKEDARYVTALATESQVGLTVNARNLELMLRRFASHPLEEVQRLGRMIYDEIAEVAPSIVIFHQANDRDQKTYPELKSLTQQLITETPVEPTEGKVRLIEYTADGDDTVAASILHSVSNLPYRQCQRIITNCPFETKQKIFQTAWKNLQFYDSMIREFEYVSLTFDIILSAACFGQLKRHRMATLTTQGYDPALGLTVPESIKAIGKEDYFTEIVEKTNRTYEHIAKRAPQSAPYILTNAHCRRALMRINARELYHISRLRQDNHAQWDIRNISHDMAREAKKVMPLVFEFIGPKDRYNEIYQNIFGQLPKVREEILPGARKIK